LSDKIVTIYIRTYYYSAACDEAKELGCRQSEIPAALQDTQYCFYIW